MQGELTTYREVLLCGADNKYRETDHTSDTDKRNHITAVCFNSKGDGTTQHFLVKDE